MGEQKERCNCENIHCVATHFFDFESRLYGGCKNLAGNTRIQDIGRVCDVCAANYPQRFHVFASDLGYANGWKGTPAIVLECREMGHEQYGKTVGKCLHEHGCEICGYKYLVDSSD